MLLLYPVQTVQFRKEYPSAFTFHYASTLSLADADKAALDNAIYIPLCFYFIYFFHRLSSAHPWYLHSIMLLLYHKCGCLSYEYIWHLHSIMLLLYLCSLFVRQYVFPIYIPLCFYFISLRKCLRKPLLSFTFHYASTLSKRRHGRKRDCNKIYIPLCFYFIEIMNEKADRQIQIYIPLCFYFILSRLIQCLKCFEFTFHYASTLSGLGSFLPGIRNNLHSIMLLLYHSGRMEEFL